MRRRHAGLVLSALIAALLLLPAAAALAVTAAHADTVVLAVEQAPEEPGAEPTQPGLEPGGPDDTENPAAPVEYESNFLWGAAIGLLVLVVLGLGAVGGLYWLLVVRPSQREDAKSGRR